MQGGATTDAPALTVAGEVLSVVAGRSAAREGGADAAGEVEAGAASAEKSTVTPSCGPGDAVSAARLDGLRGVGFFVATEVGFDLVSMRAVPTGGAGLEATGSRGAGGVRGSDATGGVVAGGWPGMGSLGMGVQAPTGAVVARSAATMRAGVWRIWSWPGGQIYRGRAIIGICFPKGQ